MPAQPTREQKLALWRLGNESDGEADFRPAHPAMIDNPEFSRLRSIKQTRPDTNATRAAHFAAVKKIFDAHLSTMESKHRQRSQPCHKHKKRRNFSNRHRHAVLHRIRPRVSPRRSLARFRLDQAGGPHPAKLRFHLPKSRPRECRASRSKNTQKTKLSISANVRLANIATAETSDDTSNFQFRDRRRVLPTPFSLGDTRRSPRDRGNVPGERQFKTGTIE